MQTAPTTRKFEAHPAGSVSGAVVVPGDKSISHRALMLSGIAEGISEVTGFLASEDCLATLTAMRALGVHIEQPSPTHVVIHGVGLRGLQDARRTLDMGNAGTAMRLFTGLLSAQAFDSQLIGDASLMKRPMERVAKPLREMGADVRTHGGTPPVDIGGGRKLRGIEYRMPVASAQVKSAVLLAALYADSATTVIAPAQSRDHSERMLASCGVHLNIDGLRATLHPPRAHRCGTLGCRGRGLADSERGNESDAHGLARYSAQHGREHRHTESARERRRAGGGPAGSRIRIAGYSSSRATRAARNRRASGVVHRGRLRGRRDRGDGR